MDNISILQALGKIIQDVLKLCPLNFPAIAHHIVLLQKTNACMIMIMHEECERNKKMPDSF